MTPDEVRLLNNDYAILFIKGERPILDKKFDLLSHKRINEISDGKTKLYVHGKDNHSISNWQDILLTDNEYEILSEEDMDAYFKQLEEKKKLEDIQNEKKKQNTI